MLGMGKFFSSKKMKMPAREDALPGRANPMRVSGMHFVNGNKYVAPFPEGTE